jgi:hypothetical protein
MITVLSAKVCSSHGNTWGVTTAALSPLRKQGDVSKDSTTPTAVLPQGSSTPPTATTSHEQGAKTSLAATTACT